MKKIKKETALLTFFIAALVFKTNAQSYCTCQTNYSQPVYYQTPVNQNNSNNYERVPQQPMQYWPQQTNNQYPQNVNYNFDDYNPSNYKIYNQPNVGFEPLGSYNGNQQTNNYAYRPQSGFDRFNNQAQRVVRIINGVAQIFQIVGDIRNDINANQGH